MTVSWRMLMLGLLLAPGMVVAQGVPPSIAPHRPPQYRINVGDELEIYVWGEDKLQRSIKVLPDGSFSFPLVGRVEAQGRLPSDIEAQIAKGLEPQFRERVPQVMVSVKTPAGLQFSVLGKVKNPGNFAPGKYVNVLEAISIAGGTTEFADMSKVLILRKSDGALVPVHVRLSDALKGDPSKRDLAANGIPNLVSGDTVIVP